MLYNINKQKSKERRCKVYRNMQVGLGRQLQELTLVIAEENGDAPLDSSPPCGQELPKERFPEVFILAGLGVRRYHRCKGEI